MQKEELSASVGFPDFHDFCDTFFSSSLSSSLEFVVVFSLLEQTASLPSPIRSSSSRALLFLGVRTTRERERKRRNKSSVAIINTNKV